MAPEAEERTARQQAERYAEARSPARGVGLVSYRIRGITWAILAHADALHDVADAIRHARRPRRRAGRRMG